MKLMLRPASPFARKVRIVALERGLMDRIELQIFASPEESASTLPAHNPLVKVPTFFTDDGTVLYDSPVICEYLDSLHEGDRLFPAGGDERWRVLRLQALGDGVADSVVAVGVESMKADDKQSAGMIARQNQKIDGGLDYLEAHMDELAGPLNIGQISVACALGYFDFRIDDNGWRDQRPDLTAWFTTFSDRASMKETFFKRPGT